jgi:dihydrodipicolinate synthase/N-acetylneuraminate lyase
MQKDATSIQAKGVYAALATPRRPDSTEADTAAYLDYLDKVSAAGVDGLVFFGSTGEFVHFDIEERMRVVGLAVRRSRLPVLVNVSHSTFSGARDLADHAIDSGAHGLLVMPPYFYLYGDAEIEYFYEAFRSTVDGRLPVYLYNLPFFTNPIGTAVLNSLLSSGTFAGIKDSSGEWDIFEALLAIRERVPFQLLAGHERIYAQAFKAGVDGVVSGLAAAVPELPVAMLRAAKAGDMELTATLATQLDAFLVWLDRFPSTVAIKEAAEMRHWIRSTVALPLSPATADDLVAFRAWFETWLPETLSLSAKA